MQREWGTMLDNQRRYFMGLPVSSSDLLSWQRTIQQSACLDAEMTRWTHERDGHVTLHYLGYMTDNALTALIQSITHGLCCEVREPIQLLVQCIDTFPIEHPKVLAVQIDSTQTLLALHALLASALHALRLPVEQRLYQPHVTLARLNLSDDDVFDPIELVSGSMSCSRVCLYESTGATVGARYRIIHQWGLG